MAGQQKKRPGLFSQGRLGSPPPELPNHEMDSSEPLIWCKRHFGNRDFHGRLERRNKVTRDEMSESFIAACAMSGRHRW